MAWVEESTWIVHLIFFLINNMELLVALFPLQVKETQARTLLKQKEKCKDSSY